MAVGETVDPNFNKGVAGQTPCLEAKGSGPAVHVSTGEQKTVCPSCGYPKEHVADRYCDLCTQARQDEEDLKREEHMCNCAPDEECGGQDGDE
jgi:hypothetical protein